VSTLYRGYGLVTANILYRMPDHRAILQQYVWQEYDHTPDLPELHRFLDFWVNNLDGPIHSVSVAHSELIKPIELRCARWH